WMHLTSVFAQGQPHQATWNIGYFFPTPAAVNAMRTTRSGKNWNQIGSKSLAAASRDYVTLWQEHTADPVGNSSPPPGVDYTRYQYVLLPGKTSTQVGAYAAAPDIVVLANDPTVQAVKEMSLGIVAANFWTDASVNVASYLTSDRKASVLVWEKPGNEIEISVSDPTQLGSTINLEIARAAASVIENLSGRITITQMTPTIKLSVNVAPISGTAAFGKAWKIRLALPSADTTAPTIALTAPSSSAIVRGMSVTTSATAADNVGVVGVQFKLDGSNLGTEDTSPSYSINWDTTTASDGSHTLTAVARDAAGNSTTATSVSVTVDNLAPTISLTAPASSALLHGSAVTVSANPADATSGVAGVQFKLNGADLGPEVTTPPYSVTWNTTAASNGAHTLTAVARDVAGNTTTATAVSVTVDNLAPTVALTTPGAAAVLRGSTVAINATASDATTGIAGVQFRLDGANLSAEDTSPAYGIVWDTTIASNGSHTLSAIARDGAGNTTTATSVSVTVDNAAPTVSFTSPASGAKLSGPAVALAATASDSTSGMAGVQFRLDGVDLGAEDTSPSYSLTWDSTTAAAGNHTLAAVARDVAGNTTTTSINVTVFAPAKTLDTPTLWSNTRLNRQVYSALQTDPFTIEFDVTPSVNNVDSPIGLSNGTATAPANLATIVLFTDDAKIEARNGSTYPASSVTYTGGVTYRVRMVVNLAARTYSTYVTPAGGSEQTVGLNYAFRTEQNGVLQLDNLGAVHAAGTLTLANVTLSRTTPNGTNNWERANTPVEPQAATFITEFEATPSATSIDALVGFSLGSAEALTDIAAAIRFNTETPTPKIDARNGGSYIADNPIPYTAGLRYRFRLVVNRTAHTYSAYVTAPGGTEQTIGLNYAFRTEQSAVASLDNVVTYVVSSGQSLEVHNLSVRDAALNTWLTFDDNVSGFAIDASRHGNHGTLAGGPVWSTGVVGDSLDLDGTDDQTALPPGQADHSGGLTISLLAHPQGVANFARFIDFGNGASNNNIILARNGTSNDLTFWTYNGSASGTMVTATAAIVLNQTQHFVATLDGSGNVKLYKNGSQVATGTTSAPPNVTRTLNYIGRSNWGGGYYNGTLDELRIFNRVLTAAEVLALKNQLLP
ncbi:MAG: Ig-like domain-containing protein, partial [Verrucomicrobiota bacterium]